MDYDRYSDTLPLLGTAVAQAMDGADAHATPSIDTALYLWKSLTFVANISGAVQYGAVLVAAPGFARRHYMDRRRSCRSPCPKIPPTRARCSTPGTSASNGTSKRRSPLVAPRQARSRRCSGTGCRSRSGNPLTRTWSEEWRSPMLKTKLENKATQRKSACKLQTKDDGTVYEQTGGSYGMQESDTSGAINNSIRDYDDEPPEDENSSVAEKSAGVGRGFQTGEPQRHGQHCACQPPVSFEQVGTQMMYVRALADGAWLDVPIYIERAPEPDPHAPPPPKLVRTLVRSLEKGTWSVQNVGVPVDVGLVVSFREAQDASRFFERTPPRRACRRCGGADRHLSRGCRRAALHRARPRRTREQERGESSARGVGVEARQRLAD